MFRYLAVSITCFLMTSQLVFAAKNQTLCDSPWKSELCYQCDDDQWVVNNKRCDEQYDCSNLSDEQNCPCDLKVCNRSIFRCKAGGCVSVKLRCNGINDCSDGSDEEGCYYVRKAQGDSLSEHLNSRIYTCKNQWTALEGSFALSESILINHWQVCNTVKDCPEGDDEHNCVNFNRVSCLPMTEPLSFPGRDKSQYLSIPCPKGQVLKKNGSCVEHNMRCPKLWNTINRTELLNNGCSLVIAEKNKSYLHEESEDELMMSLFQCDDSNYIPVSKMCDNHINCPGAKDERGCSKFYHSLNFHDRTEEKLWVQSLTTGIFFVGTSLICYLAAKPFSKNRRTQYNLVVLIFASGAALTSMYHAAYEFSSATLSGALWFLSSNLMLFSKYGKSWDITNTESVIGEKVTDSECYEDTLNSDTFISIDPES